MNFSHIPINNVVVFFVYHNDNIRILNIYRLAQLRPGLIIEPGSPAAGLQAAAAAAAAATAGKTGSGKTRAAFYLKTTPLTRASRRLCHSTARLRHFCRKPGKLLDMKAVKVDAAAKMTGMSEKKIRQLNSFTTKKRVKMAIVVKRLGQENDEKQDWLVLTPKSKMAKPEKVCEHELVLNLQY